MEQLFLSLSVSLFLWRVYMCFCIKLHFVQSIWILQISYWKCLHYCIQFLARAWILHCLSIPLSQRKTQEHTTKLIQFAHIIQGNCMTGVFTSNNVHILSTTHNTHFHFNGNYFNITLNHIYFSLSRLLLWNYSKYKFKCCID